MFAIGDVRSGSVKRVASAVGDGSAVISDLHRYLEDLEATELDDRNRKIADVLTLAF